MAVATRDLDVKTALVKVGDRSAIPWVRSECQCAQHAPWWGGRKGRNRVPLTLEDADGFGWIPDGCVLGLAATVRHSR
jgi:hypothetical protein